MSLGPGTRLGVYEIVEPETYVTTFPDRLGKWLIQTMAGGFHLGADAD